MRDYGRGEGHWNTGGEEMRDYGGGEGHWNTGGDR